MGKEKVWRGFCSAIDSKLQLIMTHYQKYIRSSIETVIYTYKQSMAIFIRFDVAHHIDNFSCLHINRLRCFWCNRINSFRWDGPRAWGWRLLESEGCQGVDPIPVNERAGIIHPLIVPIPLYSTLYNGWSYTFTLIWFDIPYILNEFLQFLHDRDIRHSK